MTDTWIIQDIEKHIAHRNRVVIIDPSGEYSYPNKNGQIITTAMIRQTDTVWASYD